MVAEVAEADALGAFDHAAARDLVQLAQNARVFCFRHPIVRRAVCESAGPAWRIGAHARAAIALAEQGAPFTSRAPHVQRCARRDNRAPAVAARWFQGALDLLPIDCDHQRKLALLMALAASLTAAGRIAHSREVLGRILRCCRRRARAARERRNARHRS